jgi:hypothetical protein
VLREEVVHVLSVDEAHDPGTSALDEETGSLISWCGGDPDVLKTRIHGLGAGRMGAVAVGPR